MTDATLRNAGILLILLPTVAFGGVSILRLMYSDYMKNPVRRRLWTAGHAHAGVLLILSLVSFQYLGAAELSDGMTSLVRTLTPSSAIFIPAAFFLSVLAPDAEKPNALINLAYVGFVTLSTGLLILGFGLISASG